MAKQTVNIGSAANDGTGDPLRTAFDKINDNFTELYSDDAGDVNSVNGATGTVVLDSDDIAEGTTNEYYTEAKVSANTSVVANTAKVTNATHTGDVTGSTALTIANNVVDHDELAPRYTDQASISTLTGTVSFNCSNASNFKLSGDLTGAYTIDLSNYKKGQIITIFPLKAQSVTLDAQGSSTNTFYKIGGVDYDNTTTNILQIECVDDSATDPVFFYSIGIYASDNTI